MNKSSTSPLTFPCDFTFKIVGHSNDHFADNVMEIMNKHFPDIENTTVNGRHSKEKKYLSLSVTVKAESQEQLDNAYRELSDSKDTVFVL